MDLVFILLLDQFGRLLDMNLYEGLMVRCLKELARPFFEKSRKRRCLIIEQYLLEVARSFHL